MKTFDRRGWTPVTVVVREAHVYKKGDIGMWVQFEDDNPEPAMVGYFVWGHPNVRYETEQEALLAAVQQTDERVH